MYISIYTMTPPFKMEALKTAIMVNMNKALVHKNKELVNELIIIN